ncbi:MAG: PpiC-type peptidyl-prolyl cis-trans isomerase, partial [Deltaproteobacteria bacterium]|nr:PpiC-type peptidyl-prolyl cis-trans isomerase [Deltaproteobacteria bacterium]
NAGSWAIKIILSFIALTFIWWGVGTYSERDRNVAAKVGRETITMSELSDTVAGLEKTYREVYGPAFTPEMAKGLNLKKQAMDSLVQRKILLAEAAKMGLSASDEEVQQEIANIPAFQQNGQFRDDLYRSVLSYNRLTPAAFEASKRVEITMKKVEGLVAAGALVPDTEAKELFRVASRKVRLLVVTADPGRVNTGAPTEGEILAKYEQAKERFRTPARVKLAVAAFTPDRFGREVNPSEAEIKAFHETNSDRFRTEERRLVSRIVLPFGKKDRDAVRKKAEGILATASKGKAEFDAQAKAHARGTGGETWLARKDAAEALSTPLFQASVDTVVGPVELPGNFVLARVNRIRFPEALPLSQVRDRVVEQIRHEKGKDLAVVKAYEALPKATAAKSVKATAAAYGVPVVETGWVGAEGAPGLPAALVQDALLLPPGEVAPVKTVGDVHYLFQVTAKEDSRVPPLSEVRDKVVAEVARDNKAAAARAALQQVLAGSNTAAELEANARKAGLPSSSTGWFAPLSEPVPEALAGAADLRKDISALSTKAPVSRKVYQGREGNPLAVAISGEQFPSDTEWAGRKADIMKGVAEQKKNAMLEAFLSDRRKSTKVEIHPEALK